MVKITMKNNQEITLLCIGNKTKQCDDCGRKQDAMVVDSEDFNKAWYFDRPVGSEQCTKRTPKAIQ